MSAHSAAAADLLRNCFLACVLLCLHSPSLSYGQTDFPSMDPTSAPTASPTEFEASFDPESSLTVFSLGIGVFLVLISIFVGIVHHRDADSVALQFLSHASNYPFYVASVATSFFVLVGVFFVGGEFSDYAYIIIGVIFIGTLFVVGFVSIIGCKYYRSYLCFRCIQCAGGAKGFVIVGYVIFIIAVAIDCVFGWYNLYIDNTQFYTFVSASFIIAIVYTSLASLASKIAQVQWLVLVAFYVVVLQSSDYQFIRLNCAVSASANADTATDTNADTNTVAGVCTPETQFNYWLIFWQAMVCVLVAVVSIFSFSPYRKLRSIIMSIQTSYLAVFDIVTDITVIVLWVLYGFYWQAAVQTVFIVGGSIFSSRYIDRYYFVHETVEDQERNADDDEAEEAGILIDEERRRRICCGRFFTCVGLGRMYHGVLAWDDVKNKDMILSEKMLKVWEMIFESFPTIILQIYIQMVDRNITLSVALSLFASFTSITYTLIEVLYSDHHSETRELDMEMNRRMVGLIDAADDVAVMGRDRAPTNTVDVEPIDKHHENIIHLMSEGYRMDEIMQAWVQLKSNPNPEIARMTEAHGRFQKDMIYLIRKIRKQIKIQVAQDAMQAIIEEEQEQERHALTAGAGAGANAGAANVAGAEIELLVMGKQETFVVNQPPSQASAPLNNIEEEVDLVNASEAITNHEPLLVQPQEPQQPLYEEQAQQPQSYVPPPADATAAEAANVHAVTEDMPSTNASTAVYTGTAVTTAVVETEVVDTHASLLGAEQPPMDMEMTLVTASTAVYDHADANANANADANVDVHINVEAENTNVAVGVTASAEEPMTVNAASTAIYVGNHGSVPESPFLAVHSDAPVTPNVAAGAEPTVNVSIDMDMAIPAADYTQIQVQAQAQIQQTPPADYNANNNGYNAETPVSQDIVLEESFEMAEHNVVIKPVDSDDGIGIGGYAPEQNPPSYPSQNAPKPMITMNEAQYHHYLLLESQSQSESVRARPHSGSSAALVASNLNASVAYNIQQVSQAPGGSPQLSMPALYSGLASASPRADGDVGAAGASSVSSVLGMAAFSADVQKPMLEIDLQSINADKIHLDFTHPNVSHFYYQGYSEVQIKQAYFVLKHRSKKHKVNIDNSEKFLGDMEAIMESEYQFVGERHPRKCNCCFTCLCDNLWQNFICCFWCRYVSNCGVCNKSKEDEEEEKHKKKATTMSAEDMQTVLAGSDNLFYLAVYFWVVTDFFVRIYPALLYGAVFAKHWLYGGILGVFYVFFEFFMYYFMLKDDYRKWKEALRYFWVGLFSVSYWFLSTMHLTYLPTNVDFRKLLIEQKCRLVIQFLVFTATVTAQYIFSSREEWNFFFNVTAAFPPAFIVNTVLTFLMARFITNFESKIAIDATLRLH